MARQPRIDFPGAFHHVMNRGAARQVTYRNRFDQQLFVDLLAQAVSRFGIEVIAYCLMSNHYHILVCSPYGQLSETMQFIGRAYTQAFNAHHERDGALFRGRFHSILIDSETYLARVARYIELNPVDANVCSFDELHAFKWSSFKYYSGAEKPPDWIATRHLVDRFESGDQYREFVRSRVPDSDLVDYHRQPHKAGRVLGTRAFTDKIKANHPDLSGLITPGIPDFTVEMVDATVAALSGTSRNDLYRSHPGATCIARVVAFDLAHLLTNEPRTFLADRYGFSSKQAFNRAVQRARSGNLPSEAVWLRESALQALSE